MSEQIELLRELSRTVQELTRGLAVADERAKSYDKMSDTLDRLDKHLFKLVGQDGNNGTLSELKDGIQKNSDSIVKILKAQSIEDTKRKVGKAWTAGYLAAAGGGGVVVHLIGQYLTK